MKQIDYGWVMVIVVVLLIVVFIKPIIGGIHAAVDKATNRSGYERGKAVFYDAERWAGKGSYRSCAMCHTPDFTPEAGKHVEMNRYVPGKPVILKDIAANYHLGVIETSDDLFNQVISCLTAPDKIGCGQVSRNAKGMDDLLFYLSKH